MITIQPTLAREIVERTMRIIPFNINVMDMNGVIVGSGEVSRIGEIHRGAQQVISSGIRLEITPQLADKLVGVKFGVNLPLRVRGHICGVIGITGRPASVRRYAELVQAGAEMILEQAELLNELQHTQRHWEEFAFQLIHPGNASKDVLVAWAQRLNIDFEVPHTTILLDIPGSKQRPDIVFSELQSFQAALNAQIPGVMSVVMSLHELAVICQIKKFPEASGVRECIDTLWELLRPLGDSFTLSAGIALRKMEGISLSYQSARNALRAGLRRNPSGRVFSYYDLSLPVLLAGLDTGWQADELRRPLQLLAAFEKRHQAQGQSLRQTLKTWFANNEERSRTANVLGIHRNTLDYRLLQASAITGLDLGKTSDRFLLYLALEFD